MISAFRMRLDEHRSSWLTALLVAVIAISAAPVRAQTPQAAGPQGPSLAELAQLVAAQTRALEAQRKEIAALRSQLEETQKLALTSHNRLEVIENAAPSPTVNAAVEARLAKIEQAVNQIPDLPADVVEAGDFPGSIAIPGTDAAIKVSGLVRTTAVASLGPLGTEDRFVTSSIPVQGSPEAGKQSRFVMTAVPSRFNLDVRSPTDVGAMRAFIEGDFAGSGSGRTFRLRHAYGQWKGFVVGQTWSTFADPDAEPDGIDFEGLNAIALFRQTQLRYTRPLSARVEMAVALENPAPDITNAKGVSQVPDVIVRFRWRPEANFLGVRSFRRDSHVNLAFLLRQIRGEPLDQPNVTRVTRGYGVGLSGRVGTLWQPEKVQLLYSFYAGNGIGRYVTDLGTLGGQDAVYDAASDRLQALPSFAWYVGYEMKWRPRWHSTFTYGTVLVNNLDIQPGNALKQTNRGSGNLTFSPIGRLDVVGEYLFGNRINKDGAAGASSQLQFGMNFRF